MRKRLYQELLYYMYRSAHFDYWKIVRDILNKGRNKSKYKPLFITFEGIDGSGKSTQAKILVEYFKSIDRPVYFTREPGGTPLAESLRNILLDNKTGNLSPLSELFLYLASRREHLVKIIKPNLEANISVISDRFVDSSVAYQGLGRGITPDKVDELNLLATDGRYPDITFLIDIAPEIGLERISNQPLDRLENEGLDFLSKIRAGYLWIAQKYPERVKIIDGSKTISEISEEIKSIINQII